MAVRFDDIENCAHDVPLNEPCELCDKAYQQNIKLAYRKLFEDKPVDKPE